VDVTATVTAIGESTVEVSVGWGLGFGPKRALRKFCRSTRWRCLWPCNIFFKKGEKESRKERGGMKEDVETVEMGGE